MPPSSSPVTLLSQSFIADNIPERGNTVSETARLHAALSGAYEYELQQNSLYQFSSALLYNQSAASGTSPAPDQSSKRPQFGVKEINRGPECILTLESQSDDFSIALIELIPVNSAHQPVDFQVVETNAKRRIIRYRRDGRPLTLKIRVCGVNVMDIESINVCVWAGDMSVAHLNQTFISLDRADPINITLLDNPKAGLRVLDEHLQSLFDNIFLGKASGHWLEVVCSYRYDIVNGSPKSSLPVLLSSATQYDQNLSLTISSALKAWYRDIAPHTGTFVLALTVFAINDQARPVLKLRELLLPIESIADIKIST